jgi:hypothetical protein
VKTFVQFFIDSFYQVFGFKRESTNETPDGEAGIPMNILTTEQIVDLMYPALQQVHIPIEDVHFAITALPGNTEITQLLESARDDGALIPIAEVFSQDYDASLAEVLSALESLKGDESEDAYYIDRIAEHILRCSIEGRQYLIEKKEQNPDCITLREWTLELDDQWFEEIKNKNPHFYAEAKKKVASILVIIAIRHLLSFPIEDAVVNFIVDQKCNDIPRNALDQLAQKVMDDSHFDILRVIAEKAGFSRARVERAMNSPQVIDFMKKIRKKEGEE